MPERWGAPLLRPAADSRFPRSSPRSTTSSTTPTENPIETCHCLPGDRTNLKIPTRPAWTAGGRELTARHESESFGCRARTRGSDPGARPTLRDRRSGSSDRIQIRNDRLRRTREAPLGGRRVNDQIELQLEDRRPGAEAPSSRSAMLLVTGAGGGKPSWEPPVSSRPTAMASMDCRSQQPCSVAAGLEAGAGVSVPISASPAQPHSGTITPVSRQRIRSCAKDAATTMTGHSTTAATLRCQYVRPPRIGSA
jgi:hypothetical protein